jgi:predicted CXXCH cytochrome family protein
VRRLALLFAGGVVWLFLAAIPALADGGPHVAPANSGVSTLTADGCAGCHRAHTAQGAMLLAEGDEEGLCLSCHGAAGTGSAVDVENGIQYVTTVRTGGTVLGALRGGGFVEARIDSGDPYRNRYGDAEAAHPSVYGFDKKVGVLTAGEPVTSAHIKLAGASGVDLQNTAWGNGAWNSGVGPTIELTCASCHNPHG